MSNKSKKKQEAAPNVTTYKNKAGIFKLIDGRLYDADGNRTSAKEQSKHGDLKLVKEELNNG